MRLHILTGAVHKAMLAGFIVITFVPGAKAQTAATPASASTAASPPGQAGQQTGTAGTEQKKAKKTTNLNAVTVTGQLAALQRAQAIKQDAVNTVDSISAEEAGKFPDPNVADALQRVPGVSVDRSGGESSRVAVRGFGPDFVAVTVNGRQIATASGSRAFNFDVLPSEIISVAKVQKTSLANIPEVDIGGVIEVETARPLDFSGLHGAWSAAGVNSNLTGNWEGKTTPKASGLVGWTNTDHTFGWLVSANYYKRNDAQINTQANSWYANQDIQTASGLATNVAVPETLAHNFLDETRTRKGVSGALDWKPMDQLTVQLDALYSSYKVDKLEHEFGQYTNTDDIQSLSTDANGTVTDFVRKSSGPNVLANDYVTSAIPSYEKSYQNGLNLNWDFDPDTRLNLDLSDSKAWNKQSANGYFFVIGTKNFGTNPTWSNGGEHQPPQVTNILPPDSLDNLKAHCCGDGGQSTNYTNRVKQYKLDFSKNFYDQTLSSMAFGVQKNDQSVKSVSFGTPNDILCNAYCGYQVSVPADAVGAYVYTPPKPIHGVSSPGVPEQFLQYDPDAYLAWLATPAAYNQLPEDKRQALLAGLAQNGGSLKAAVNPGSFNKVIEKDKAAYAMFDFQGKFGDLPWTLDAGVRYLNTQSRSIAINRVPIAYRIDPNDSSAGQVTYGPLAAQSADGGYSKWLPSLSFKLNLRDDLVYRAAYSKTLTPPQLSNLYYSKSFGTRPNSLTINQGNPQLQPYSSRNYDMGLEWYIDESSYISLEGFLKQVSNFSTLISTPVPFLTNENTGQPFIFSLTQPVNLNSSKIYGEELTINYQFTHVLPAPFDGLGVATNYTHVSSSTQASSTDIAASGKFAVPGIGDSANFSTYYEKGPIQLRLAYNWRDKYLQSISSGSGAQPNTRSSYGQLDFSGSYALNKQVSVFASATNLTHQRLYDYSVYTNRFLYAEADGSVYTVGVRGTF